MLMSLVRAFTVYRSPGSRCVPHLVPCTAVMANRRLATLCSHLSAGAESTGQSPDTPKVATFKCANGLDIFTKAWGEPSSDRKVLALHGFLDNSGSFALLGPALARDATSSTLYIPFDAHDKWMKKCLGVSNLDPREGFEVVAMDFPGHGRSAHVSKDGWYTLLEYPEYVMEAARSLGWDKFSLVGHSLGGAVASLVAASHPELVERCAFIDILGPFSANPGTSPKLLRSSIASKRALLAKGPKPYASFDRAVQVRLKSVTHWGGASTVCRDAGVLLFGGADDDFGRRGSFGGGRDKAVGEDGQVKFTNDVKLRASSPSYLTEEAVLTYLRAIECACLVVRGETGMLNDTPEYLARKEALASPFRELIIPGSHHLHLDEDTSPLVASHVAAFLHDRGL